MHGDYSDEYEQLKLRLLSGDITLQQFNNLKSELEAMSRGAPEGLRFGNTERTWFRDVPYELVKRNKLLWDPDRKLWWKPTPKGGVHDTFELRPYNEHEWVKQRFDPESWVVKAMENPQLRSHPFVKEWMQQISPGWAPQVVHRVRKPNEPEIELTHMHYFPISDMEAERLGYMKLKRDKNGNWYLPRYNKSGANFRKNYVHLTNVYGKPRTVTLK